jgi:5,10-methylenetetrahydrofolate reductase
MHEGFNVITLAYDARCSDIANRPTVIVELDTPKHLDTDLFFENIGKLDEANIDAVTLADNSLACNR